MSIVIYITKFVVSFLILVVFDKIWNRLKNWNRNRKLNKLQPQEI
jgi:hypothetical protein